MTYEAQSAFVISRPANINLLTETVSGFPDTTVIPFTVILSVMCMGYFAVYDVLLNAELMLANTAGPSYGEDAGLLSTISRPSIVTVRGR